MTDAFRFEPCQDGLIVRLASNPAIPVSDWTSAASAAHGAGGLIRLRDDGDAVECEGGRALSVAWPSIAGLTSDELRYIGLPDAAPVTLQIVATGAISDPDFEITYAFAANGRRVIGVRRTGAWLTFGGKAFSLLDPLYSVVDAIDRFQWSHGADLESRMLHWGRIADILPEDAIVDDHLRSMNIVVASSFELHPFVNNVGEPDFDPIAGRSENRTTHSGDEEQVFAPVLPPARQKDFARRFRGLSRVKHRYAAGAGFYVVLSPGVERVLRVVKRAQEGTVEERRDFLRNVSGYVRGAIGDEENSEIDIDVVFSDDGLSDRISGIGIWTARTLPWVKQAREPWLPPEEVGLQTGSRVVKVPVDGLDDLRQEINRAIDQGHDNVVFDGADIPANESSLGAIDELIRRVRDRERRRLEQEANESILDGESAELDDEKRTHSDGANGTPGHVLLIKDNLESLQFERERRDRVSGIATADPNLRSKLMPHQSSCLEWLFRHWEAGNWGALLADDMGLGKTLEALAFLACVKAHAGPSAPLLVVAPTGLLKNWLAEHDKHLEGRGLGRAMEAHGAGLRKIKIDTSARSARPLASDLSDLALPKLDLDKLRRADWVLTTYETLRDYQHSFGRIRWKAAVFDEAQKIKNPAARLTDAALAMNIDFALMMTGTPVENRPADIWSILDRAEPGTFGTLKSFSDRYERTDGESSFGELHRLLTKPPQSAEPQQIEAVPLMLRRLKEDHISGLPEKSVHRRLVEMPPRQARAYEKIVFGNGGSGSMLHTLHRLRSVSLHPGLPTETNDAQYIRDSARLSEAFRILENIKAKRQKALLFVEALMMQDFLIGALRRKFRLPQDVLVINGSVSGRKRKERVDRFQCRPGFDVMILSPRAGGVGLTLTAANHVIHLSRWWNPAVEDQCTDRVFRIGQDRPVRVYLPLARHPQFGDHSFDLKLDALMERKREMNRLVLAPTATSDGDISELYRGTMTGAREVSSAAGH